jgi:hypothetical protein
MKKHLLIVALCCFGAFAVKAQTTLINSGFETWTNDAASSTPSKDPNGGAGTTGWWDFNFFNSTFLGSSPISVYQNVDTVHSGTYSALVESVVLTSTSYTYLKSLGANYPDTIGVMITGNVSVSSSITVKLGEPFSNRISAYNFFYQYYPHLKDTASCAVVLSHFEPSTKKRNTLGAGYIKMTAANSWTMGTVPIFWDSATGNPDTIFIVYDACSSISKSIPQPGSKLYLDDASVVLGVDNINAPTVNVSVYPSPALTEVNFQI